jgi:hypothetical protein
MSRPGGIGGDPSISGTGVFRRSAGVTIFPLPSGWRREPAHWDVARMQIRSGQTAMDGSVQVK